VTDEHIEFHPLPPGKVLSAGVSKFQRAVEEGSPERDRLGEALYHQLFDGVSGLAERKPLWLIAAADELFDMPIAALVIGRREEKPVYLVEKHATERIQSALMLRKSCEPNTNGLFLGLADGIYNVADPRWKPRSPRPNLFGVPLHEKKIKPSLELARLAGSAREINACARIWKGPQPPVLLTGSDASRDKFEYGLRARPAVIHMAAHVLTPRDQPKRALIDLGLSPLGQPELLNYTDIANLDVHGATVVVDGCASANAGAQFGGGVMGLTRAWLVAGAVNVIGTRWPIPDDTGDLFQSFYSNWKASREAANPKRIVAESLRQAQLSVLHSNTWRSDPKYWSAFYVVGKE